MTTPRIFPTSLAIAVSLLTSQGQTLEKGQEFPTQERVGDFHIENGTMEDGLRALRQTNPAVGEGEGREENVRTQSRTP